jgi:drug/metabolite transporter (DMT)-like permease
VHVLAAVSTARSGMPPLAVAVVLVAAVTHAVWNALAHAVRDKVTMAALMGAATALLAVPLVVFVPSPPRGAWPYIAVSALLHVGYNGLLLLSYRLGEFSQVYPVARGTSPWLVGVAGALFAGDRLSPVGWAGVAVVSAGLMSLVFSGGHRPTRADVPALGAALGTGVAIAAYTVVDGLGVRTAGNAAAYAGWLFLIEGALTLLAAVPLRRGRLLAGIGGAWRTGLACGALSIVAYGLVLWAQTVGALAAVAALRETSVIAGAIIGAVFFREGFGRGRMLGAVVVVAGIALINVG